MEDWRKLYQQEEDRHEEDLSVARYSEGVKEHFKNPRNVGFIEDPDGIGEFGSLDCGDYLEVYLRCTGEGCISDIKWQAYGCAGLISTTSAMTELVMGKTIKEALFLTDNDIIEHLGGLPEKKKHCSLLCLNALHDAIKNYKNKGGSA